MTKRGLGAGVYRWQCSEEEMKVGKEGEEANKIKTVLSKQLARMGAEIIDTTEGRHRL